MIVTPLRILWKSNHQIEREILAVQIQIAARHGHLHEEVQNIIKEKAAKLLHFFDRITMISVIVDFHTKTDTEVEIQVDAEHKHDFVAKETNADLMKAVDGAIHRIQHQIHKYKEKIQAHH